MNFTTCDEIFNLILPEVKTLSGTDIAKNVILRLLIHRFHRFVKFRLCGVKKGTKNSKRNAIPVAAVATVVGDPQKAETGTAKFT